MNVQSVRNVTHWCRLRSTMEQLLLPKVSEELGVEVDTSLLPFRQKTNPVSSYIPEHSFGS